MFNNGIKAVDKKATNNEAPSFDCRKIYFETRLEKNNRLELNLGELFIKDFWT